MCKNHAEAGPRIEESLNTLINAFFSFFEEVYVDNDDLCDDMKSTLVRETAHIGYNIGNLVLNAHEAKLTSNSHVRSFNDLHEKRITPTLTSSEFMRIAKKRQKLDSLRGISDD